MPSTSKARIKDAIDFIADNIFIVSVIISLFLHVGLFGGAVALTADRGGKPERIEFAVIKKEPPPKPIEVPPPPPPKKEPVDLTKVTKLEKPVVVPPNAKISDTAEEPPKEVFGVTKDSVADGTGDGMTVRVGNTLMKEMEKEFTPPDQVKPYFIKPIHAITEMPKAKRINKPDYPPQARAEEREGVVILEVEIDEEGKVRKVSVLKKAGFGFDEAAVKAIYASSYYPAKMGEESVAVKIKVPVRFMLTD